MTLQKLGQYEYSTVLFGAVSETPLLGLKNNEGISDLIDDLEARLKVCNYTNEYGRLIEEKIKELKQLLNEPSQDTPKDTPKEPSIDYKYLINNLNIK